MEVLEKTSGRSFQSGLFLSNLRDELDKMTIVAHQVSHTAEEFFDQGYSSEDVRELLIIDGIDPELASSCVNSLKEPIVQEAAQESQEAWGFTVKDAVGNTLTHEDLGIEISASSDEEAKGKIENIISTNLEAGLKKLLEVHQLGE